jgi:predicted nucleotidyltransferase
MKSNKQIGMIRRKIIPILKEHDVKRAALFGSFARGDETSQSDIDLLIEFRGSKSLFDLVALKQALEAKTHKNVDVLTYRALHPSIRDHILNEQVVLL